MISAPFIGVAGNIGVGKTTFTEYVAKNFGWRDYYESVIDNPYLKDFYKNMDRWSFNLQIYFLQHRFSNHIKMAESNCGVIQDRTIYEDVEIFARNLFEMKLMTKRDWETYFSLFLNMDRFLKRPSLIIYLQASTDTLVNRINNRNRDFEKNIDVEYLHRLNIFYERWISKVVNIPILTVNTDNFNIFTDCRRLNDIYSQILKKLDDD